MRETDVTVQHIVFPLSAGLLEFERVGCRLSDGHEENSVSDFRLHLPVATGDRTENPKISAKS